MGLPKFTSFMLSNQPDQTAYLLNKLVSEGVGGGEGGKLYPTTGQHTDGAMTQKATTDALGLKADSITVGQQLATKVDKVAGKELSSNDFTDEELAKLNGIEDGAQVNVQSDWDQTNTSADDYIKNKPTIPGPYTLPPATASTLGGIKVGNNLSVTSDGTLSADGGTLPDNLVYHDDPSTVVPTVPYVNTGDIVDGAVTSDKIDLNSLILSSYKSVSSPTIETVYKTDPLTVKTAGKYFCYTFNLSVTSASTGVLFSYVFLNGTQMTNGQSNGVANVRQQGDVVHILDCQAGDTIQGGFYLNPNTGSPSRVECNFIAIRVA